MDPPRLPLDHIAIAVRSLNEAVPVFEQLLGVRASTPEVVETQGVRIAFLEAGPALLELLEPLAPDSPVGRFLDRRGPGLHHIALRVADLPAELQHLQAAGVRLIDENPRAGARGHRIAFIHPHSLSGVLVELVEA
jgi:methylmalonyl-CoA epimerase